MDDKFLARVSALKVDTHGAERTLNDLVAILIVELQQQTVLLMDLLQKIG